MREGRGGGTEVGKLVALRGDITEALVRAEAKARLELQAGGLVTELPLTITVKSLTGFNSSWFIISMPSAEFTSFVFKLGFTLKHLMLEESSTQLRSVLFIIFSLPEGSLHTSTSCRSAPSASPHVAPPANAALLHSFSIALSSLARQ